MPLSAVVGQADLKLALQLAAVDPHIGGVLVSGERGTAKSTAARALAALLPEVEVNEGCVYGCPTARPASWCDECRRRAPAASRWRQPAFVTLPLGATADQLVGTLDLEQAIESGQRRFSPGLLARANQGVLYVDEVNLLEDHLVDVLLDVAASGVNVVAREGVSVSHPAELLLVGTMNPEEGELRPQLIDRFGLCVQIRGLETERERAEVAMRRLAFDDDPAAVLARFERDEQALAHGLVEARARLRQVQVVEGVYRRAARLSLELGAMGHRAEVLLIRAARALAALQAADRVGDAQLERVAPLVLVHRVRRGAFEQLAATATEEAAAVAAKVSAVLAQANEKKKHS